MDLYQQWHIQENDPTRLKIEITPEKSPTGASKIIPETGIPKTPVTDSDTEAKHDLDEQSTSSWKQKQQIIR